MTFECKHPENLRILQFSHALFDVNQMHREQGFCFILEDPALNWLRLGTFDIFLNCKEYKFVSQIEHIMQ